MMLSFALSGHFTFNRLVGFNYLEEIASRFLFCFNLTVSKLKKIIIKKQVSGVLLLQPHTLQIINTLDQ